VSSKQAPKSKLFVEERKREREREREREGRREEGREKGFSVSPNVKL
jgi:hypothetical protein